MKKINVYLDDLRKCPEGYTIARTVEEAIELFRQYECHYLSLDHDLGEDEHGNIQPEGIAFVDYFCENGLRADAIYIHTKNPVGRERMYKTLLAARKRGFIDESIEIYNYSITEDIYEDEKGGLC